MRTGLVALALLALGTGAAQAQDCQLKRYDSVPMEVRPERILLPVTFGTLEKQLAFRLDGGINALSGEMVDQLDMHVTSVPPNVIFHRDGLEITRIAHARDVHLGHQAVTSMDFLAMPRGHFSDPVVGDIGTQMFGKVDFELDMAGAKLNLFSTDHCPGKTVYWTNSGFAQLPIKGSDVMGFIRVPMVLDGHPVTVALSTAGRSRIGMNAMRRIFNVDETSQDMVPVSQDLLGHKLYRYPFKTITADGLTIANPEILVFEEAPRPECKDKPHFGFPDHEPLHSTEQALLTRCFGGEDVVLGLSVIKKLRLYVSNKEKILYLTGADAK